MTTLISKDETQALELHGAKGFKLNDGDMLITCDSKVFNEAEEWLINSGVFGIYFDPTDEPYEYNSFMIVSMGNESHAIRLYK